DNKFFARRSISRRPAPLASRPQEGSVPRRNGPTRRVAVAVLAPGDVAVAVGLLRRAFACDVAGGGDGAVVVVAGRTGVAVAVHGFIDIAVGVVVLLRRVG